MRFDCFTVAKVIDVDTQATGSRTIDISGEDYGYIVSHKWYGQQNYQNNRTWTLTLTGLQSNNVEIYFEQFDVEKGDAECYDYLQIDSLYKLCEKPTNPIIVNVDLSTNEISFTFTTDNSIGRKGFWLRYKGMSFSLFAKVSEVY